MFKINCAYGHEKLCNLLALMAYKEICKTNKLPFTGALISLLSCIKLSIASTWTPWRHPAPYRGAIISQFIYFNVTMPRLLYSPSANARASTLSSPTPFLSAVKSFIATKSTVVNPTRGPLLPYTVLIWERPK